LALLPLDGNYVFSKTPWLSWSELLYGLQKGYIDDQGASSFACNTLTPSSPEKAYELSLLDPQELYLVQDLIKSLASNEPTTKENAISKPWIYLFLSHLFENKDLFLDPLEKVEELYADLDYPEEVSSIVRYMPLPEGEVGSEERLYANWKSVISAYEELFSFERNPDKNS
jgi:hypothetical protein